MRIKSSETGAVIDVSQYGGRHEQAKWSTCYEHVLMKGQAHVRHHA